MNARKWLLPVVVFLTLFAAAGRLAADDHAGSFERTLKVTGPVELEITTGSGNIAVRSGDASAVQVRGTIRVSRRVGAEAAQQKVQYLESNPPIEQSGNFIRVGRIPDPEMRRHISISYEIAVPAATRLRSETGSGDQTIENIKGPVKASTGSGSLHASGLEDEARLTTGSGDIELASLAGAVYAETGSGSIRAERLAGQVRAHTGSGDIHLEGSSIGPVKAETGSGNVEIHGVQGILNAQTGSGSIIIQGEPRGDWKLETGSGNVMMQLPAQAGFSLYAHTGSGSINSNLPITVQGKLSRSELRGTVRGGGSLVEVGTGSGDIRIE
ncbi:MAG: DUF4097 family beta strand repeat-containing protein [Acidobacteriia bacterium]|nr:DUF4097 family beta strand repeat-containing protein [Terriglobia bacterium]